MPAKIRMHMKHCCTPKSQDTYVFHDLIITQGNTNLSLHRETQYIMYFHSKTHQRHSPSPPNLSSPPPPPLSPTSPPPIPAHVGGKSPHTIPILSLHGIKCPFLDIVTLPYSDPSWSTDNGSYSLIVCVK